MRQYHKSGQSEDSPKGQPHPIRHWRPGEPIPRNYNPDALVTLARNAAAFEQWHLEEAERAARKRRAA